MREIKRYSKDIWVTTSDRGSKALLLSTSLLKEGMNYRTPYYGEINEDWGTLVADTCNNFEHLTDEERHSFRLEHTDRADTLAQGILKALKQPRSEVTEYAPGVLIVTNVGYGRNNYGLLLSPAVLSSEITHNTPFFNEISPEWGLQVAEEPEKFGEDVLSKYGDYRVEFRYDHGLIKHAETISKLLQEKSGDKVTRLNKHITLVRYEYTKDEATLLLSPKFLSQGVTLGTLNISEPFDSDFGWRTSNSGDRLKKLLTKREVDTFKGWYVDTESLGGIEPKTYAKLLHLAYKKLRKETTN